MTVGFMPIGGNARRMNGIPKFLLPIAGSFLLAILYERMFRVTQKIILDVNTRNRVWVEMNAPKDALVYEFNAEPMSRAILLAREHIDMTETVLFGMPDTYWTDENVYETLLDNIGDAIVNVATWYTNRSIAINAVCVTYASARPSRSMAWKSGRFTDPALA